MREEIFVIITIITPLTHFIEIQSVSAATQLQFQVAFSSWSLFLVDVVDQVSKGPFISLLALSKNVVGGRSEVWRPILNRFKSNVEIKILKTMHPVFHFHCVPVECKINRTALFLCAEKLSSSGCMFTITSWMSGSNTPCRKDKSWILQTLLPFIPSSLRDFASYISEDFQTQIIDTVKNGQFVQFERSIKTITKKISSDSSCLEARMHLQFIYCTSNRETAAKRYWTQYTRYHIWVMYTLPKYLLVYTWHRSLVKNITKVLLTKWPHWFENDQNKCNHSKRIKRTKVKKKSK